MNPEDIATKMTVNNGDPPLVDIDEKRSPGTPNFVPHRGTRLKED
jgi:hypothetical protein